LGSLEAPAINRAKEILAFEATQMAHGTAKAEEAFKASVQQFGLSDPDGKTETSSNIKTIQVNTKQDLPTVTVAKAELENGLTAIVLFKKAGLANTNSEARRLIQQVGAYVNEEQVAGIDVVYDSKNVADGELILRAGKKRYKRVVFE
ncbi:tyrosine--tRNA ligase, partial [bacterium]|nr:tyrosine--tRNA ligase [bacterium]